MKWTINEIDVLKQLYEKHGAKKCHELIPNHSVGSIMKKAQKLGIKCDFEAVKVNQGIKKSNLPKHVSINTQGYPVYRYSDGTRKLYHRYVMEQHLGRKLLRSEVVHHTDGDITNFSIDNLELTTQSEHMNKHRCKLNERKKELHV